MNEMKYLACVNAESQCAVKIINALHLMLKRKSGQMIRSLCIYSPIACMNVKVAKNKILVSRVAVTTQNLMTQRQKCMEVWLRKWKCLEIELNIYS